MRGTNSYMNGCSCPAPGATYGSTRPNLGALGFEVSLIKLGGLGDIDAFEAAAQRRREAALQAAEDRKAEQRAARERQELLMLTQESAEQAGVMQEKLLETGRVNLNTVMKGTLLVAGISLGTFAVTRIFAPAPKSKKKKKRSRSKS